MVRAIPGPVFSVASFTGSMAMKAEGIRMQLVGSVVATLAIFLPSALLVLFFFPVWQYLKRYAIVFRALEGINAVVVGLMFAASLFLLKTMDLQQMNSETLLGLGVIALTFVLLKYSRIPAPFIVLGCILLGAIF